MRNCAAGVIAADTSPGEAIFPKDRSIIPSRNPQIQKTDQGKDLRAADHLVQLRDGQIVAQHQTLDDPNQKREKTTQTLSVHTIKLKPHIRGQEKAQVNFVPERNEDVDTWRVLTAVEREAISTLSERKESLTRAGDEADAKPETEEEKKQRQDMILQKIIGGSYDHVSLPNRLNREVEGVGQIKPGSVLAEVERVLQGNGTYRTGDVDSLLTRVRKNVGDTARRK
ncbi:MAG: hypothetical protein M4579_006503 [Chaenotheca gracillima]|nr:MAG: hypothetical protein M4579_006503 [Chaenotheca gracillima]